MYIHVWYMPTLTPKTTLMYISIYGIHGVSGLCVTDVQSFSRSFLGILVFHVTQGPRGHMTGRRMEDCLADRLDLKAFGRSAAFSCRRLKTTGAERLL